MSACKSLARASAFSIDGRIRRSSSKGGFNLNHRALILKPLTSPLRFPSRFLGLGFHGKTPLHRSYSSEPIAAPSDDAADSSEDTVEELLTGGNGSGAERLMKMERRSEVDGRGRWFPYLDVLKAAPACLDSREVIEALDPYIMETRKRKIQQAVAGRSYSVCLVVEGLSDLGNVSAAFRSADALGVQSVHVVAKERRKRYRDNRHVSRGAEKWLDIESWNSPLECFKALKLRGYRIATTHLGENTVVAAWGGGGQGHQLQVLRPQVSIHDMDWSCPTAIVVGNEHLGISKEALQLSDLHCNIPMKGMVDSFNVSVAAGILMHHAVCDRVSRLGYHGDLTSEERQILLAEFYLRHRESTISFVQEYAKRKVDQQVATI